MNKIEKNGLTSQIFVTNKKELERTSLNKVIEKISWLRKYEIQENSLDERPDYILINKDERIGIEHFYIDLLCLNKKKKTSFAKYSYNEIRKMYCFYHKKVIENKFCSKDGDQAAQEFENIFNVVVDAYNSFDYSLFIEEWKRVFDKHYKKRQAYIEENKLTRLGFLIEVPVYFPYCIYECIKNIKGNSEWYGSFRMNKLPITSAIAEHLNRLNDGVNFYILMEEDLLGKLINVRMYHEGDRAKEQCDSFILAKRRWNVKIDVI